ncbi:MAG: hypothetical protein R3E18_12405 [Sphingomonadaceae bacterium]
MEGEYTGKPLPSNLWKKQLVALGDRTIAAEFPLEADLRVAFCLQNLAPIGLRKLLGPPIAEAHYETLLSKDLRSAALCLVEHPVRAGAMAHAASLFESSADEASPREARDRLTRDLLLTWLLTILEVSRQF